LQPRGAELLNILYNNTVIQTILKMTKMARKKNVHKMNAKLSNVGRDRFAL